MAPEDTTDMLRIDTATLAAFGPLRITSKKWFFWSMAVAPCIYSICMEIPTDTSASLVVPNFIIDFFYKKIITFI